MKPRALEPLYAATVFLSAFLLFQIQPMIAKMILPWFGGVSTVWSTCMLFFQVVLLAGYLYAHWLGRRDSPRRQSAIHTALLAASLLALPIAMNPRWKPAGGDHASLRILALLCVTVGLPYLALSTTSSLMQLWYARTHGGAAPYRLFALSNAASLLALLTYPVVVEPAWPARLQAGVWSGAYACFVLLCTATAWLSKEASAIRQDAPEPAPEPSAALRILWIALAACASILLLAVTTFLTQDVAPIPFLWVLPLAVYLLSFIVCFNAPRLYVRPIFVPLAIAALIAVATGMRQHGWKAGLVATIAIFTAALFLCCVFCHGELARRKPHPRRLTGFYVNIALGGALGGVFVGLIAPNFFNFYYEFPIGLALCAALILVVTPAPRIAWLGKKWQVAWRPLLAAAFCGYAYFLGIVVREEIRGYLEVRRNFYGQLRVDSYGGPEDEWSYHMLVHGLINHGEQMLNERYRRMPVTYFCAGSGIGQVMAARLPAVPQKVGMMGLGCGTLAAYGRRGDTYRIYEINPLVPQLANSQFTYLKDTEAKIEIVPGDARLSLEREPPQQYDVLVMDAFSGDSVPVHLVTREAMAAYFRQLKPQGLLVVNVTNTFLDLRPVIERAATSFGKVALLYRFDPDEDDSFCFTSSWVVVADPSIREMAPGLFAAGEVIAPRPGFRMWTDNYSSLWGILY